MPARAGTWERARYERDADLKSADVAVNYYLVAPTYGVAAEVHKNTLTIKSTSEGEKVLYNGHEPSSAYLSHPSNQINVWYNNGRPTFNDYNAASGAKEATGTGTLTICAVFRWKPNQFFGLVDDPNHKPTPLYIIESSSVSGYEGIRQWDGNAVAYSPKNPYKGTEFTFKNVSHPFEGAQLGRAFTFDSLYQNGAYAAYSGNGSKVTLIETEGKTEVRGPSRTFKGDIELSKAYENHGGWDHHGFASLAFSYQATACRFSLDVNAGGEFNRTLNEPRDKALEAYAGRNWMGRDNTEAPTEFFWGGGAGYAANLSSDLLGALNNPKYEWKVASKAPLTSGHISYGRDTSLWPNEIGNRAILNVPENEFSHTSTPTKSFIHEVSDKSKWEGPETTTTKVKIIGNNAQKSELTAKVKIKWYRDPTTRFRSESKFEIIDLDTGEITPFSPASVSGGVSDEEAQLDAYIAEINATKQETFETGQSLVSLALEGEMMVGSWFVPDATDVLVPVAGHVAGKLYKSVKKLRVLSTVLEKVNKIGGTAAAAVRKKRLAEGKSEKFLIQVVSDVEKEGKLGHLPPGSQYGDEAAEDALKAKKKARFGYCFVADTPVLLSNGMTKAIDQIRAGDLVLSRDENTGDTQAKRVVQTFQHQENATLVLTFSNGESVETTSGHPFYVEGRGFVKAGELGIGTSIVTRAGPQTRKEREESAICHCLQLRG